MALAIGAFASHATRSDGDDIVACSPRCSVGIPSGSENFQFEQCDREIDDRSQKTGAPGRRAMAFASCTMQPCCIS